jgi:hypothetical protein
MPLPIICAHEALCQFAAFSEHFSKPQRKYFVTVLLALLLCQLSYLFSDLCFFLPFEGDLPG